MEALSPSGPCGWLLPCSLERFAFSPDGRYLALATGVPGAVNADRTVLVVETTSASVLASLPQGARVLGLGWVAQDALAVLREPAAAERREGADEASAHTLVTLAVPDGGELAGWTPPQALSGPLELHTAPAAGVAMVSSRRWAPAAQGQGGAVLFQGPSLEPSWGFATDTDLDVPGASQRPQRAVLDPDGASVAVVLGRWSRARGTDRLGAVCVRTRSGRCLRVPVGLTTDAADVAWVGPNEVLITARDGAWLAVPGDTAPTTAWLSPRAEPWPGASPLVSIDREARVALVAAREEGRPRDGAALRALDFERRALSTPLAQGEPLRGVASWCGAEGAFAVLRPPKDGLGTALALGRRTPKGVTLERTLVLGGTMDREVLGVSSDQRWLVLQYHDWVSELIDLAVLRALPTVAQRVGPVQNQVP